jgi:hypothetical protein
MNILQFLFYLGVINIIFGFIWKWVFVLPTSILFTLINFNYGMRLVKVFGTYMLVSLMAILTLTALGESSSVLTLIFYPLIGGFILFMGFAGNSYEARKEAGASMDWEMLQRLDQESGFEAVLMLGAITSYLVMLFVPSIAINNLTIWLFNVIDWAFNLPIIGWLIGIVGVMLLLSIIFQGVIISGVIISGLLDNLKQMLSGESKNQQVINSSDEASVSNPNLNGKNCSSCGESVPLSYKYCTHCGTSSKG